jgi:hypothetical protein
MEQALCPVAMIARARAGYYDDFRSELATPIIQLVADLRAIHQDDLARRVEAGEFDATKEESDAWARSPEGQATFRELAASAGRGKGHPVSTPIEEPREQKIGVESIFGAKTRQPLVTITLPGGQDRVTIHPDEARDLALNLLQAAEGALSDGFLMDFFTRELDLDLPQSAAMMVKFRGYRTRKSEAGT